MIPFFGPPIAPPRPLPVPLPVIATFRPPHQCKIKGKWQPCPPPQANVPGPLPVLGAVAAFGWSRKLRQRIKELQ
jgi:hypothetical protein